MNDDPLIDRIVQTLEQDSQALPAQLRSRLNRRRQQVLARLDRPKRRYWLPAGLATALSLALVAWLAGPQPTPPEGTAALAVEDLQLLAEPADLELIEELEFYAWLEQTDAGNS